MHPYSLACMDLDDDQLHWAQVLLNQFQSQLQTALAQTFHQLALIQPQSSMPQLPSQTHSPHFRSSPATLTMSNRSFSKHKTPPCSEATTYGPNANALFSSPRTSKTVPHSISTIVSRIPAPLALTPLMPSLLLSALTLPILIPHSRHARNSRRSDRPAPSRIKTTSSTGFSSALTSRFKPLWISTIKDLALESSGLW